MKLFTKKKSESFRLHAIAEKLQNVKEAISIGLIKVEGNNVYINSFFWKNKGREYLKAFAKNMFIYVGIATKDKFDHTQPVNIFDMDTKKQISSFFKDKATQYK